jgi:hypothetical protein
MNLKLDVLIVLIGWMMARRKHKEIALFIFKAMVSDKLVFGIAFKEQDSDRLIPHLTLIEQTKP